MRIEEVVAAALEEVGGDRFVLSLVVSKRAEQLSRGAEPLVEADKKKDKLTDIALAEIAAGMVIYEEMIDKE